MYGTVRYRNAALHVPPVVFAILGLGGAQLATGVRTLFGRLPSKYATHNREKLPVERYPHIL